MSPIRPNANIVERFKAATPASAVLARRANELLPSGISHDGWGMDPYPIYVERARGPIKWDVDGNSYVDYFGGHGALLLGHNHPTVLAAVHRQLDLGTRSKMGGAGVRAYPVGRASSIHGFRDRGHAHGAAHRPGRNRTSQIRAVQRAFPRLERPYDERPHQPF